MTGLNSLRSFRFSGVAGLCIFSMACVAGVGCGAEPGTVGGISTTFIKMRELRTGDHWKTPMLPVEQTVANCSRYDAIWCAQLVVKYHQPAWTVLCKNKKPGQFYLRYVSGDSVKPNSTFEYLDYEYVDKYHPEWFLLKHHHAGSDVRSADPEERMRWSTDPNDRYYNSFYLDIGNREFQKWAAQYLLDLARGQMDGSAVPYDGIGMDNVRLTQLEKVLTKIYPDWKYANRGDEYNRAYLEYLEVVHNTLKANGFVLVVNQTLDYGSNVEEEDWQRLYQCVDGAMDEKAMSASETVYWHDERWLTSIKRHEEIINKGLIDWWVAYPRTKEAAVQSKTDRSYQDFMYTYCSWLLVYKKGQSYYHASRDVMGYANPVVPWYEEYDLPLGKPRSARYSQGQCWLRDYENAKIIVNPTGKSEKVVVDKDKYWLDWVSKVKVSEVEIPPKSGIILLPTPSR
jgi:hypothetical protein